MGGFKPREYVLEFDESWAGLAVTMRPATIATAAELDELQAQGIAGLDGQQVTRFYELLGGVWQTADDGPPVCVKPGLIKSWNLVHAEDNADGSERPVGLWQDDLATVDVAVFGAITRAYVMAVTRAPLPLSQRSPNGPTSAVASVLTAASSENPTS